MKTNELISGFKIYFKPNPIRLLFLGISAGLPLLLIFSSLSLWLREAGFDRSTVTFFSWAALGYSFKFIWAPLVDRMPFPILNKLLGRRRSWLFFSQVAVVFSLLGMAFTNPTAAENSLTIMAIFAVMLGFSAATQDICVDAYRIECDKPEAQAALSATYIAGYRIGMILSGAGALYLASYLGTSVESYSYSAWMWTYVAMAGFMGIGIVTTLTSPEPKYTRPIEKDFTSMDYSRFLSFFALVVTAFSFTFFYTGGLIGFTEIYVEPVLGSGLSALIKESLRLLLGITAAIVIGKTLMSVGMVNRQMVYDTYVDPIKEFFDRYPLSVAILVLCLIGLYRISDVALGAISNVFYQDLGFTKTQIADVSKTFGLFMTIFGGFIGGFLTFRYGVMKILFLGALLSAATNLLFMWLATMGEGNLPMLYLVLSADNLSAGIASTAFVAFLSALTNISFTAIQYAIFTSLMMLLPKVLGGYSGSMVDALGYNGFFAFTAFIGIPVLIIIIIAKKKLPLKEPKRPI